jgi:hypothetical protein
MQIEGKDDGQPNSRQVHPGLRRSRAPLWSLPAGMDGLRAEASFKDDRGGMADDCTARAFDHVRLVTTCPRASQTKPEPLPRGLRIAGPGIERAQG